MEPTKDPKEPKFWRNEIIKKYFSKKFMVEFLLFLYKYGKLIVPFFIILIIEVLLLLPGVPQCFRTYNIWNSYKIVYNNQGELVPQIVSSILVLIGIFMTYFTYKWNDKNKQKREFIAKRRDVESEYLTSCLQYINIRNNYIVTQQRNQRKLTRCFKQDENDKLEHEAYLKTLEGYSKLRLLLGPSKDSENSEELHQKKLIEFQSSIDDIYTKSESLNFEEIKNNWENLANDLELDCRIEWTKI